MSEARLVKPQLRNLHIARAKKTLPIIIGSTLALGLSVKYLFFDKFEDKLEEFYKTYDAEKVLKVMNDAGLMDSCPKD